MHLSALLLLLFIVAFPACKVAAAEAVEGLPPLPGPTESGAPFFLTAKNVSLFHDVLIAPLAAWLKAGKFVARAVDRLEKPWQISTAWERATEENAVKFTLDESGSLAVQGKAAAGLPFGGAAKINEESDPERRARKILWNMLYAQFPVPDLLYGVELAALTPQGVKRRAGGILLRNFNRAADLNPPGDPTQPAETKGATPVLLQELVQLLSPPVVYGLASINWRHSGTEDDEAWQYSPVIERSRRVFSANRGDPIVEGFFAPDDLFVWGMKPQRVRARVVDEKMMLVPFPSLAPVLLQDERITPRSGDPAAAPTEAAVAQSVLTARGTQKGGSTAFVQWNYETFLFSQAASWIPTSIVLVPRKVWILECLPADPFYPTGREILIVDQEMMLPIYKIVYTVAGIYQRTLLGGWLLASSEERKVRFPFLGFLLALERGTERGMSLTTQFVRTFEGRETAAASAAKRLLDITAHGPRETSPPPKAEEKVDEAVQEDVEQEKPPVVAEEAENVDE